MESMGSKPRRRRSFTAEFKAEIVELCQRGNRPVSLVARDFDLAETAVRGWVKQAERDAGTRNDGGLTSGGRKELAGLRRENRRLREDVDILKRATAFFASGDPVNCYQFIEAEKAQWRNVKRACELLKVSRAAYYAARDGRPSHRERNDAALDTQIKTVHDDSKGRYGAPRIHAQLRTEGCRHSRKRVARLMRAAGLRGKAAKRWKETTIPDPAAAARADAIRRDFTADASKINTWWCGDIMYNATWEGWLYLATVIDIASRRVAGYALADHLRTELVADALANAVAARDPDLGVIFHSEGGCQYTSAAYAPLAEDCHVTLSVGRTGQCWDNALAESFFSSLKGELTDTRACHTRAGPGTRSWSTSADTTAPGCTPRPATAARSNSKTTTRRTSDN
jgi:transposase InsO family protein/transposase-like protein